MAASGRRTARELPKRSKPPKSATKRVRAASIVTIPPTQRERRAAGERLTCDICHAKINEPLGRGKRVIIWSFTVKGAKGKIFNRCQRHLKNRVRV